MKQIPGLRRATTILLCCLLAYGAGAQQAYRDSLQNFRRLYTADLFKIIGNDTAFLSFFPPDRDYAVDATVQLLENQEPFKLTTSSGKTKDAQKYALLTFTLKGKKYRLYAYQLLKLKEKAGTANELFLPFTDITNGHTSYGGGRYIDLQTTDILNNRIRIDFNKAYNPYCAFTTGYNCPIPPRENDLPLQVKAGEKYREEKFHRH